MNMERNKIKACVLRVGGTNCDEETKTALEDLGVKAEILHFKRLLKKGLLGYHLLVIPGGFSFGDYVRAGAIWGKQFFSKLKTDLSRFVEEGRLVLGICNGFQVLVEMGMLPAFRGISDRPEASLAPNLSAKYECRWIRLKYVNRGKCAFTRKLSEGKILRIPVGHGEGRFLFAAEEKERELGRLLRNDQLVFRYAKPNGEAAEGEYPHNPNGSLYDIAGICNPKGNVFGLMPHPERAFYWWQAPDWTRREAHPPHGDGWWILESGIEYLTENF